MRILKLIVVALLVLTIASCAKPPQAEIDAAKAAVEKAMKDADVARYAPDALAKARDALAKTQAEVQAKRYDRAKAAALEASAAAAKAIADAPAAKARSKEAASSLIAGLKAAIPEAEKLLASAKKVRGIKLDAASASKTIEAVKSSLTDIERDFASGDYLTAEGKAESSKTALADVSQTISTAVQAATRKK